ncbi:two-component sensor histidine kinase [Leucobacter sp. Psy1]|uniref:sensor histidine kinase n=1 Tax=Leucobacter sp. Psy1 TaxID=2875729 RepID=UPI00351CC4B6|nr:two-component sensor histidine kinase [Leucobacter sp. Psy1]
MESPTAVATLVAGTAFVAAYAAGALLARGRRPRRGIALVWIAALTVIWGVLVWLSPEGAYLVFPLFFLYLHLLPGGAGVAAILATTGYAICALGFHLGFSIGGVIGPLVGAGVALLIGFAYRALSRESAEREALLAELLRTRQQLARTEREQGALEERARLARDIHDTVAQGLSSIQMLLRAAERDTAEPEAGYVRLARETAAESLAETRQIIRELTPARLDDGLPSALRRLAADQQRNSGIAVEVRADETDLPMASQTALLRIAQGAISNAVRHADATRITVDLATSAQSVTLTVQDDGRGFDVGTAVADSQTNDSFGLQAMRERVAQFDGHIDVTSRPDAGTRVTARLPLDPAPPANSSTESAESTA